MKVLFLTTDLFSDSSGIAQVSRIVCKALSESPRITCLDIISLVDPLNTSLDPRYLSASKTSYSPTEGHKVQFITKALSLAKKSYDICLASHIQLIPVCFMVKQVSPRTSLVSFVHGIEVWQRMPWIRRTFANKLDRILAVSNFTRTKMAEANDIDPSKISILNNCLDPYQSFDSIHQSRDQIQLQPISLLTVSRLSEADRYKGHIEVLHALTKIRQQIASVNYYVVGKGALLPELRSLTRDLKLDSVVHFLGYVDDYTLRSLYSQCDVFIMPSKKEGFGLVFAEAMSYGKPVIAGNCDATPEVVSDGKTGILVSPGNVDEIAKALVRLLTNQELRKQYGEEGAKVVARKFSFSSYSKVLLEYLIDIAGTKSRSAVSASSS